MLRRSPVECYKFAAVRETKIPHGVDECGAINKEYCYENNKYKLCCKVFPHRWIIMQNPLLHFTALYLQQRVIRSYFCIAAL